MLPGMDMCCTDPAQYLITAGEDLIDDLDHDLFDLSVRRVKGSVKNSCSWHVKRGLVRKKKKKRKTTGSL